MIKGTYEHGNDSLSEDALEEIILRLIGLIGGTYAMTVTGQFNLKEASVERPNNTTGYAAGDVISTVAGTVLEFNSIASENGGTGLILKAQCCISAEGDPVSVPATIRLHLFSSTPDAIADNAPYTQAYADRQIRLGYIDFDMTAGVAGSDCVELFDDTVRKAFKCESNASNIYGIIETLDAFTPSASMDFHFQLITDNNKNG